MLIWDEKAKKIINQAAKQQPEEKQVETPVEEEKKPVRKSRK